METWQKDKPDVKKEIFLALLFKQVVADTIKSDLKGWKSCVLLEMGIRVRAIIGKLWIIMIAGRHYDTLWKGAKVHFTPLVSALACRLHTQAGTGSLCRRSELMKSRKKHPKTKSEHSNKNKTPAEADDKWSHQRQMLENLGLRCGRLLWLQHGWMMHLSHEAPTLA